MHHPPRGILLPFPAHVPDLDGLPEGTLLEPGTRVRYQGRLWKIDAPHCHDPDDDAFDIVTLIDASGARLCLRCGPLKPGDEQAS